MALEFWLLNFIERPRRQYLQNQTFREKVRMTKEETLGALLQLEFKQYNIESMENLFNEALASVKDAKRRIDKVQQGGVSPLTRPCQRLSKGSGRLGINKPKGVQFA